MDGAQGPAPGPAPGPVIFTDPSPASPVSESDRSGVRRAPVASAARTVASMHGPQDADEARRQSAELAPLASQISVGMTALQERQRRVETILEQTQNASEGAAIAHEDQMTSLTEDMREMRNRMNSVEGTVNGLRGDIGRLLQQPGAFGFGSQQHQPGAFAFGPQQHQPAPVFGAFGAASVPDPTQPFTFSAAAPMELDNQRGRDLYSRPRRRARRAASGDTPHDHQASILLPAAHARHESATDRVPRRRSLSPLGHDFHDSRTPAHFGHGRSPSPPRGTMISRSRSRSPSGRSSPPRRRRARSRSRTRSPSGRSQRTPPSRRRMRSRTPSPGPRPQLFKSMAPDKFTGVDQNLDLDDWITQVERYFRIADTPDKYMVDVAAACLSGPASKAWAGIESSMKRNHEVIDIDAFYHAMKNSFGQVFPEQQIRKSLKTLRQETTVAKYARLFQAKVGQLRHKPMASEDQIDYFMQGLKEPIRRACHWDPAGKGPFANLSRLIEYATAFEMSLREDVQAKPSATATLTGEKRGKALYQKGKNQGTNQASNQHPSWILASLLSNQQQSLTVMCPSRSRAGSPPSTPEAAVSGSTLCSMDSASTA